MAMSVAPRTAAALLLPIGGIGTLGSLGSLAALTAFIAFNVALLWLRRTQPILHFPHRRTLNLGWTSLPALLGLLTAPLRAFVWRRSGFFLDLKIPVKRAEIKPGEMYI